MTPAKPQQMTSQQDNPDDLIAELTKLMALETRPASERDKPAPIASAPPVAAIPQRPAPTTIRIPGVEQQVRKGNDSAQFGKTVEPAQSWPRPAGNLPAAANDGQSVIVPATGGRAADQRAVASVPVASPDGTPSFEFDFGFNRQRPEALPRSAMPATQARIPSAAAASPAAPPVRPAEHDPIAELIAAELKGVIGQPAPGPVAAPVRAEIAPAAQDVPAILPAVQALPTPKAEAPRSAPEPMRQVAEPARPAPQPQISAPAASEQPAAPRLPAEGDRFATAPVFGLGNRPMNEASAPKPALDPIDEIENLIGEAVRVELGNPQPATSRAEPLPEAPVAPASRPVVPPLGNNFSPRRTPSLRESEAPGVSADEAILAAAAAARGDEVGRIDTASENRRPAAVRRERRERMEQEEERRPGVLRQFVVPMVAGLVLVAIGFGLYWQLGMGHHDGAAPVLTADATPAKTVPPKPADTTPHSVVMDELSGNSPKPSSETLVSRDQTQGTDGATEVASTTPSAADDAALANRKVRTVTVRPDGTIISGDDSVAGGAQLPVDRPNVPAVPGIAVANATEPTTPTSTTNPATDIDTSGVPSDDPIAQAIAASAPDVAAPVPATHTAAIDPATSASNAAPVVPMPRSMRPEAAAGVSDSPAPSSAVNAVVSNGAPPKPVNLVGETPAPSRNVANIGSAAPAAAAGVAHIQLASQPSEAAAQSTAASLQKRFGNLFNGAKLSVVRADLGSKGVYYRVVMPTSSLGDAQQLCSSIRSGGGDCVAANG